MELDCAIQADIKYLRLTFTSVQSFILHDGEYTIMAAVHGPAYARAKWLCSVLLQNGD